MFLYRNRKCQSTYSYIFYSGIAALSAAAVIVTGERQPVPDSSQVVQHKRVNRDQILVDR